MADMIAFSMDPIEKVEKVYPNQTVQLNRKALKEQSSIGNADSIAETAEKNTVSFRECMEKAIQKETAMFQEGEDVVMAYPPASRTSYNVDMNKSKEEMTTDEYKQYICNKVSALPVSDSMRACSSGILIFKEEAFESMKNNPAYENEVMEKLKEALSVQLSSYEPNVGYQVIGKGSEECYGASIPVKNYGWMTSLSNQLASSLLSSSGLSGLKLVSSWLLPSDFSGLGLTANGLLSSGFSGSGLLSSGLSSMGLAAIETALLNKNSLSGAYAANNRTNMVNAYKNTAENKNSYKNTRSTGRRWRV